MWVYVVQHTCGCLIRNASEYNNKSSSKDARAFDLKVYVFVLVSSSRKTKRPCKRYNRYRPKHNV